nr:FHA domain-containing protein [Sansalvadorimonas sp. 2012CJ34-2]
MTFTVIAQPDDASLIDSVLVVPEQGGDIGRSENCEILLPDNSREISRRHAELTNHGGSYFIRDWSSNGLKVNEETMSRGVEGQQLLRDGDIVSLGKYRLLVSQPDNKPKTQAAASHDAAYEGQLEPQFSQENGISPKTEKEAPVTIPGEYSPLDNELSSSTTNPPLLTEAVDMESKPGRLYASSEMSSPPYSSAACSMGSSGLSPGELLSPESMSSTSPVQEYRLQSQPGFQAASSEGLAGINALADEILKEFDPDHLQHILRPWRKRFLHRASWWTLYRRYHQQLQRTGELHVRLREWSLRAGGLGRGGS